MKALYNRCLTNFVQIIKFSTVISLVNQICLNTIYFKIIIFLLHYPKLNFLIKNINFMILDNFKIQDFENFIIFKVKNLLF